ncbi:STAS domain-containing protein [bacterium]|nr:STAS domain-containing protein [bacterium]
MDVRIEFPDPQTAVVYAAGDIDLDTSPVVRKELIQLTNQKTALIIVELSQVRYMDSSGVATMVEGLQRVKDYDGRFVLAALASSVREVFELSRLDKVFELRDTLDLALEAAAS